MLEDIMPVTYLMFFFLSIYILNSINKFGSYDAIISQRNTVRKKWTVLFIEIIKMDTKYLLGHLFISIQYNV